MISVTSGGDSSPPTLARETFINGPTDTDDTRAVALTPDVGSVDFVAYCGPDNIDDTAKLIKYNTSYNEVGSAVALSGPAYIETKSALRLYSNVAFIAASDGGMIAVDIETDAILFTIPNETRGGLTDDLVTANDVVVGTPILSNQSLLFIANGEYGVRVYELGFKLEESADVASDLSSFNYTSAYQGYINNEAKNSANSLMFRNGFLYIGTGLGGVRIIYVSDKSVSQSFKRPDFK